MHERALITRFLCGETWPEEVLARFGALPWGPAPGDEFGSWAVGEITITYTPGTIAEIVGPGSGWEHVFAVMNALSGRFGGDGVRLVVYFG